MSRFIAILRDSYREALSTWVVPVMLVLAGLLVLFVASVSFRQVGLQDELEKGFGTFNWALGLNPANGKPRFVVENVTGTNPTEPWKADYEFDIALYGGTEEFLKQARTSAGFPVTRRRMENFLGQAVPFLDNVKVEEVADPPAASAVAGGLAGPARQAITGEKFRFHATTRGTKIADRMSWPHQPTVLFVWDLPFNLSLREGVYTLEKRLVNDAGAWITLLVSVVITAGFIPNMLRKGALDLYIAKPISRVGLLIYKYIGGLIFVLMLTAVTVTGVWAVIGLRTGIWTPHFLALIPLLTFYFAVLYSISTLAAVLTRSTLVAILATITAWGLLFGIGWGHEYVAKAKDAERKMMDTVRQADPDAKPDEDPDDEANRNRQPWQVPTWLDVLARALYNPLPRTYDLDDRMIQAIAHGVLTDFELKQNSLDRPLPPWPETIGVSLAFIAVMLGLASWRLVTRDG
ncbi:MAG TPA: ABC transporter permease [Fimbriiglobus sp.]|nr:ABC transporter permease [Fimbriiglobus sp.]